MHCSADDTDLLTDELQVSAQTAFAAYLALRRRDRHGVIDPGATLIPTLMQAIADNPQLLRRPIAPITAILLAAGLERHGPDVGLAGVPWRPDEVKGWTDDQIRRRASAASFLVTARLDLDLAESGVADFLAAMADLPVLGFIAGQVEEQPPADAALELIARAATRPYDKAVVALLRARSAEGDGDSLAAERHIADALREHPQLHPALEDAGDYAADRGDASTADRYLHESGLPYDYPLREALGRLTREPAAPTLRERVPLMYARLLTFATRAANRGVEGQFRVTERESAVPLLLVDLAIFEGGLLQQYLEQRGPMLRDDERDLLERWRRATIRPYEVRATQPRVSVTFQPLTGGEAETVHDRRLSGSAKIGQLVVMRLLHDGTGPAVVSRTYVLDQARRDRLLEVFRDYSPRALVEFFDAPPAQVRLVNDDGHEVVMCTVTFEVPATGAAAAWRRLGALLTDNDGPNTLLWGRDLGEQILHLGTVARDGRLWTLNTASRERMAELEQFLFAVVPDARLVASTAEPAAVPAAGSPAPTGPFDRPVEELIQEAIRQYEQEWMDEKTPALGGLSPREAARQGLYLDTLELVLTALEQAGNTNTMNAARMRADLGLPDRRPDA